MIRSSAGTILGTIAVLLGTHATVHAQGTPKWEVMSELAVQSAFSPDQHVTIRSFKLGMTFQEVLTKLKSEHPKIAIVTEERHFGGNRSEILVTRRLLNIMEGIPPLSYERVIKATIAESGMRDVTHFVFTSPATGHKLIAISRNTSFENATSYPAEVQVAQQFIDKLGAPQRGENHGKVWLTWALPPGATRHSIIQCHSKEYINLLDCGVQCRQAISKVIDTPNEILGMRSGRFMGHNECAARNNFLVLIELSQGSARGFYRQVDVQAADIAAAVIGEQATVDLVRKIRSGLQQGLGKGTYKN